MKELLEFPIYIGVHDKDGHVHEYVWKIFANNGSELRFVYSPVHDLDFKEQHSLKLPNFLCLVEWFADDDINEDISDIRQWIAENTVSKEDGRTYYIEK